MVLIHSRQGDDTTVEIIKWLRSMGKPTFRINTMKDYDNVHDLIDSGEVQSIYYNGLGAQFAEINTNDADLKTQLRSFLKNDANRVWEHLLSKVPTTRSFGNMPFRGNLVNKLKVLDLAAEIGFAVPETAIVSTKAKLLELKDSWGRLICKTVEDSVSIATHSMIIHGQKTEEITEEVLDELPEQFFPTLVQQLIEKQFEVRTFLFGKTIESLACFTQSHAESIIDGRRIDTERPQRLVPYLLPDAAKEKASILIERLSLNYGSFDFIVTPDDELIFLEINPFGQYGFLSSAANYYLEKEIASFL